MDDADYDYDCLMEDSDDEYDLVIIYICDLLKLIDYLWLKHKKGKC